MLLRYLNVDVMNMSHFSSDVKSFATLGSSANDVNWSVSLCRDCSSLATDFFELFQTLEGIRLQLNMCFYQLHEFMETGAKNEDRVREFERRIKTGNVKDLIGASIAESLRKEMKEKVSRKLKFGVPRISLLKVDKVGRTGNHTKIGQLPEMEAVTMNKNIPTEKKNCDEANFDEHLISPVSALEASNPQPQPPTRMQRNAKAQALEMFAKQLVTVEEVTKPELGNNHEPLLHAPIQKRGPGRPRKSLVGNTDKSLVQPQIQKRRPGRPRKSLVGNTDKSLVQPQIQKRRPGRPRKSLEINDKSMLHTQVRKGGRQRASQPWRSGGRCEICGKYFSQKSNLDTHRLQMHMWTVFQDRVPSSVSEVHLESALDGIVAKSKEAGKMHGRQVHVCPFCKSREGYSLRVHLLKFHPEEVISEAKRFGEVGSTSIPKRPTITATKKQTRDKPVFTTSTSSTKYSCNSCEKVYHSLFALKAHFKKNHLVTQSHSKKIWKCSECDKCFTLQSNLRTHRVVTHPAITFCNRVPSGLSDQDFRAAVAAIVRKSKEVSSGKCGNSNNSVLECPHCGKHVKGMQQLRSHVIRCHLEEVVQTCGGMVRHEEVTVPDVPVYHPSTKVEYIDMGMGDEGRGISFEFESEIDPLSI